MSQRPHTGRRFPKRQSIPPNGRNAGRALSRSADPPRNGRSVAWVLLAGILALLGAALTLRLPSSILPDVTFPIVKVLLDSGDRPAAEMLPAATSPLEEAALRVPGVERVRSITSRGSSEISVLFRWGTDMQIALQRVEAEAMRVSPSLPQGSLLDIQWMNPAVFPILGYALTSDRLSQAQLLEHAEYQLKPALLGIEGLAQVQNQGGRKREFQIHLDALALAGHGLSPSDVIDAVKTNAQVLSAGLVARNHELYLALVDGRPEGLRDLEAMTVTPPNGPPVRLGDLGQIEVADAVSYVRTTANGKPAVLVNVLRHPAADTVRVSRDIDALLRERPELIPAGADWFSFYDQAVFVADAIRGVRDAIVIGVALAALVLLAFLRSFRMTLVAVLAIPLSVAIAFLGLAGTAQTINLMTLAGVAAAIGLLADDAIVIVEGVRHAAEDGASDPIGETLHRLGPAIIGSSLSTTVVFAPFAFLSGIAGAFFRPLALTMALALLASLAVSILVLPVFLAAGRHRHRSSTSGDRPAGATRRATCSPPPGRFEGRRLAGLSNSAARTLLARRWVAVLIVVVSLGLTGWLFRHISTDFLPSMDEGSIILDYWAPPGTSLEDTDAMLAEAEKVILGLPDVQSYSRRTGTQLGFFLTEPNRGDYVIRLKPRSQRRKVERVIDDLRKRIAVVSPGLHTDFGQLIEDELGDLTGGAPQPIEVVLFGTDPALLANTAAAVAHIVSSVQGTEDVFDGVVIAGPALDIKVDPRAAAQAGLTTQTIQAAVEPALVGTVVGPLRVADRLYDIRVIVPFDGPLGDLPIRSAAGAMAPLSSLTTIGTGPPEAEINRENLASYVSVTGRVSGANVGGTVDQIRTAIEHAQVIPPGMSLRFGGQYAQQVSSFHALLWILVGGIALVFLVVLFTFGDLRAASATAVIALTGLAGCFVALTLTGISLSVPSYVGAIMISGIVGENAIFMVREAQLGIASGIGEREAWLRASERRLRPVAMTVLASALALMPLAIGLGAGSELMQPLAIAVIGGFAAAGPLVLWILPALALRGRSR